MQFRFTVEPNVATCQRLYMYMYLHVHVDIQVPTCPCIDMYMYIVEFHFAVELLLRDHKYFFHNNRHAKWY